MEGCTSILKGDFVMNEVILSKENFEAEVLKSDLPVLVDFWATWCGPCKMLAPTISKIAEEKAGVIKVCKLDVDEEPEIAQRYGIASIPTLKVFVDGKVIKTSIGVQPKSSIEAMLP
jgi:thioredoxin 1